jgi:hypothetical protein
MLRRRSAMTLGRISLLSIAGLVISASLITALRRGRSADLVAPDVASTSESAALRPVALVHVADSADPETTAMPVAEKRQYPDCAHVSAARAQHDIGATIGDLARRDPAAALSAALEQTDENVRRKLLALALCGWAQADLAAAGNWLLTHSHLDRTEAWRALFKGGICQPDEAVRFTREIAHTHPEEGDALEDALLNAFCGAGAYDQAAAFAAASRDEHSVYRLGDVYLRWSEQAPESAWHSALELKNSGTRFTALEKTIYSWSRLDPRALAEKARQTSAGPERTLALTMALRTWLDQDLDAASAWLMRWEPTGTLASVDIGLVLEE